MQIPWTNPDIHPNTKQTKNMIKENVIIVDYITYRITSGPDAFQARTAFNG
jgi:hypothetical protein